MKRIENLTAEKLVSVLDLFGTGESEKEENFVEETKGITFTVYKDGCIYGSDGKDYFYDVEISDSEWEQLQDD